MVCSRGQDDQSMELSCACKPHHSVSIIGVVILSEARTVECYTSRDGYLKTVRGIAVEQTNSYTTEAVSTEDDVKLFHTMIKFEEKIKDVTLKFLGFGSKPSFTIGKLQFVLVCVDEQRGQPAGIDMSKVKGYLSSMGTSIPEGGLSLLKSVEQYQATQLSGYSGLQSILASQSAGLTGRPPDRLSALLSMITSNRTVTQSQESDLSNQSKAEESHDYSQTISSQSNPSAVDFPDNQSEDSMFAMLKGICGKVSAMRVSQDHKSQENSDRTSSEQDENAELSQDVSDESDAKLHPLNIEVLKSTFEKTASEIVSRSEERLMKFLDVRLNEIELRINNKLDNMMKTLQKNGHPPQVESEET